MVRVGILGICVTKFNSQAEQCLGRITSGKRKGAKNEKRSYRDSF